MDNYNRSGGREGKRGGITVNLSLVHLSRNKGGVLEGRREREVPNCTPSIILMITVNYRVY